jgi:hypothetical protein
MTRWTARFAATALPLLFCTGVAAQGGSAPSAATRAADDASGASSQAMRQLNIAGKPWTGDFDRMLKRRLIRVDLPYSRSLYFLDKGRERGLGAELGPGLPGIGPGPKREEPCRRDRRDAAECRPPAKRRRWATSGLPSRTSTAVRSTWISSVVSG